MIALYETVTRNHAISALLGAGATTHCGGQFALDDNAILLFATLSADRERTHMPTSESLEWRPEAADDLPAGAIPTFDRQANRYKKKTHIFLTSNSADRWLYAGTAHLGSHSLGPGPASYSFDEGQLPREHWLALGGYTGWSVMINMERVELGQGDLRSFELLLKKLPANELGHVSLTRWENDQFNVYLNAERGFHMYLKTPDDSGLYLRDDGGAGASEHFECPCCGIDLDAPRSATVTRQAALGLALQFFATGIAPRHGDPAVERSTWTNVLP